MDIQIQSVLIGGLFTFVTSLLIFVFYYRKRLEHSDKLIEHNAKQLECLSQQIKNATLSNLASIVQVERSIGEIETNAFRFHGIEESEIEAAGVSKKELAYLVASFTAGRIYDACVFQEDSMAEPLPNYHYRYKMLAQPDIINAWPLIARMMTGDKYIKKLELTIGEIQNMKTHNRVP